MSSHDLRTPGERALQEVRAARVMLRLASGRHQTHEAILGNVNLIQDRQPALAASLLVREALRMAPYRRLVLLNVAQQLLQEHGMNPDADRQEAQSAAEYVDALIQESKEAIERRDKWIKWSMNASMAMAVLLIISAIAAIAYVSFSGSAAHSSPEGKKSQVEETQVKDTPKTEGANTK